MKKAIAITALAGALALCAIGGVACSNSTPTQTEETKEREKVVTIADFETWQTGMQLIRTGKYFGTINVNTDMKYVKSGKKSALLHPLGGYRSAAAPILFFPTQSETYDFDHSDFSDADKVTFEFYNAEETPVDVSVGLVTSITGLDTFQRTSLEYQPLATGWNTVTYTVDVSALSINADVTSIQGIYVAFKSVGSREEADAPDIYMDDVMLYRKDSAPAIKDLVALDENEYSDFEKDWQKYTVGVRNTADSPEISLVNAVDYKVGAAPAEGETDERPTLKDMEGSKISGNRALRVYAPTSTTTSLVYPGIEFASVLLQRSKFGSLPEEDYGRVEFVFDVYNNSPTSMRWGVSFYNESGRQRMEYAIETEPYQWTEFRILIKDLYDDYRERNKNSTELFTSPGEIALYLAKANAEDMEFFMDNFRYEVEERDMETKPTLNVAPFIRVAQVGQGIALPVVHVTDKYDLNLEAKIAIEKKIDGEWKAHALGNDGLIPIDSVGDYRLVVSATNSIGNETKEEYYFRGVETVESNVWISYDFEDEKSNVHMYTNAETNAETNKTEWLENVTMGGETRTGVVKATTDNADRYGAGYFGLRFPKQLLDTAAEANWDYFTISLYIDAPVSIADIYSFQVELAKVPTGCWTELTIKRDDLNKGRIPLENGGEMDERSRINESSTPMSDNLFFENFSTVCGDVPLGDRAHKLLFVHNVSTRLSADQKIAYYIDKVTWGAYVETSYDEGDDYVSDIYADEWADPWLKKED